MIGWSRQGKPQEPWLHLTVKPHGQGRAEWAWPREPWSSVPASAATDAGRGEGLGRWPTVAQGKASEGGWLCWSADTGAEVEMRCAVPEPP